MNKKRRFRLFDNPQDWTTCFGLDDNPFGPTKKRYGFNFSELRIETNSLRPNIVTGDTEKLYEKFFAEMVDNFSDSLDDFYESVEAMGGIQGLRDGPVFMIYGSRGSGKTTFSNVCCYHLLKDQQSAIEDQGISPYINNVHCEIDLDAQETSSLKSEEITSQLFKEMYNQHKQRDEQISKEKDSTSLLKNHPEIKDRLTFIVLKRLTSAPVTEDGLEKNDSYRYLSRIRQKLMEYSKPLIFVTTSDEDIFNSFSRRLPGQPTETKKFKIGELDGLDVIKYIEQRVDEFRCDGKKPPDSNPLFPFRQDCILKCFTDLKREGKGKLPFRNINKILTTALRLKKQKLLNKHSIIPYETNLKESDIQQRIIDNNCLNSAIYQRLQ